PSLSPPFFGRWLDRGQYYSVVDLLADGDLDVADRSVEGGGQGVFHLHGFQHDDRLTFGDGLSGLDRDGHDPAGHGRAQRAIAAVRAARAGGRRRTDREGVALHVKDDLVPRARDADPPPFRLHVLGVESAPRA